MLIITSEPTDVIYQALIKFALSQCSSFSLVWRNCSIFDDKTIRKQIESELSSLLIKQEHALKWPGTQQLLGPELVRHYRAEESALAVLSKVYGLYSWLHPLPEDLAFYSTDAQCWFGSIAHEQFAWFEDQQIE
jgi:hypothetical protein